MEKPTPAQGRLYTVTSTAGCTVTDTATGKLIQTCPPGVQTSFAACGHAVIISDDSALFAGPFEKAPAQNGSGGGSVTVDQEYNPASANPQSGTAVAGALAGEQAEIALDAGGVAPATVLKNGGVYNISVPAEVVSFDFSALTLAAPSALGETVVHLWVTLAAGETPLADQTWGDIDWVNEFDRTVPHTLERGKEYLVAILRRGNYIAANIAITK